ncbi:MAG: DUF6036 family nucleotidyltransferase [Nanoarchaeota archaeon]
MISDFKQITELLGELHAHLKKKVTLYLLGGGMMLYYTLKDATKDMDVVVETREEFLDLESALKNAGFSARIPSHAYRKLDLSQILIRDALRIDLFEKSVCKGFSLSPPMKQRATSILKLENIELKLCSHEDVFLFKTFTEREGDIDDCLHLVEKALDWKAMLAEIRHQIKTSRNKVWITWIGERLDILEDRGLTIPIMKEVNRMRIVYFKELEKKNNP